MGALLDSRREAGRIEAAARRRLARLRHRGDAVECPCCGRSFGSFAPDWNRPGAICPGCGAHERHRALALYLRERGELGRRPQRMLHFAPEHSLELVLTPIAGLDRVTADLEPGTAQLALDITALDLPDESFDVIICSHVLEHVEDDRAAMSELRRVLRRGGWALVMVPLDLNRTATLEDPSITSQEERVAAYWQADHVRLYAPDIAGRLREAGFEVTAVSLAEELPAADAERYGLISADVIFRCDRPAATSGHQGVP